MTCCSLLLIFAMYFLPAEVAVTVRPSFAMAPGSFLVRAMIEKHEGNRLLVLEAMQHGIFAVRRTPFQIDGAQSQRVFYPDEQVYLLVRSPRGRV